MEHEIIGHTRKAYKTLKNPNKSVVEKVKEILVEILIIVFAVTFAAFIERAREHSKEQSEAKEFLIGLKSDLKSEVKEIEERKREMNVVRKEYILFKNLTPKATDSLEKNHIKQAVHVPKFNLKQGNGRYEGFKSSGKIQTIENNSLRNDILEFYQSNIPFLDFSENAFNVNQIRLEDLIINAPDDKNGASVDMLKVLSANKAKTIFEFSISYADAVLEQYDLTIKQANKIITEVDKNE
jgi:hypothetical protein